MIIYVCFCLQIYKNLLFEDRVLYKENIYIHLPKLIFEKVNYFVGHDSKIVHFYRIYKDKMISFENRSEIKSNGFIRAKLSSC